MTVDYVKKAEAAAMAFRFRGLAPTKAAVVMLCAHAAGPERCIGDAPDLFGNWGGTQRRKMTDVEKGIALKTPGYPMTPMDPFETLHGDSDPKTGKYSTWFHRSVDLDGTPNDVRAACIMLADIMDLRHVSLAALSELTCGDYAEILYASGYYKGFFTDPAKAIAVYTQALGSAHGEWLDALANWTIDDSIPARPAFFRRAGETNEDVYARAVAHYVGCDDGDGPTIHHRTAELAALYACTRGESMAELKRPTNCGEFHLRLLGALGCTHPLATTPYAEALHAHSEGALGMLRQIASDHHAEAVRWTIRMKDRGVWNARIAAMTTPESPPVIPASIAALEHVDEITCDDYSEVAWALARFGEALSFTKWPDWKLFTRGRLALYATGNNAHEESSQSTPDANGIADHAGAGRSANGVSWGRGDIRSSAGRPLIEVYATEHLIRVADEQPTTQRSATLEGDAGSVVPLAGVEGDVMAGEKVEGT